MASAEAWAILQDFRREWIGRKGEPTEDDYAELIDEALLRASDIDWEGWDAVQSEGEKAEPHASGVAASDSVVAYDQNLRLGR